MEPPSNRISIVNDSGVRIRETLLIRAAAAALERHPGSVGDVCILLTSDEAVQLLNKKFRDLDEATDVLTFSGGEFPHAPLGDVAIAVPYASRQSEIRGATLDEEVAYLAIHGVLHLCGFEDESPEDRRNIVAEMNIVAEAADLAPDRDWYSRLHAAGSDL